jgi:hypothetical protein
MKSKYASVLGIARQYRRSARTWLALRVLGWDKAPSWSVSSGEIP